MIMKKKKKKRMTNKQLLATTMRAYFRLADIVCSIRARCVQNGRYLTYMHDVCNVNVELFLSFSLTFVRSFVRSFASLYFHFHFHLFHCVTFVYTFCNCHNTQTSAHIHTFIDFNTQYSCMILISDIKFSFRFISFILSLCVFSFLFFSEFLLRTHLLLCHLLNTIIRNEFSLNAR